MMVPTRGVPSWPPEHLSSEGNKLLHTKFFTSKVRKYAYVNPAG